MAPENQKAMNWSILSVIGFYVAFVEVLHSPISLREIWEFYRTPSRQVQSVNQIPKLSSAKSFRGETEFVSPAVNNRRSVSKWPVKPSNLSTQANQPSIPDTLKSPASRSTSDFANSQSDSARLTFPFDLSDLPVRPNFANASVDSLIEDTLKGRVQTSIPDLDKLAAGNEPSILPIRDSNLNKLNSITAISDLFKPSIPHNIGALPLASMPPTGLTDRSITNLSDLPTPSVPDLLQPRFPPTLDALADMLKGAPN